MNIQLKCAECGEDLTVRSSDMDLYHNSILCLEQCECMAGDGDDVQEELDKLQEEFDELEREFEDLKDAANDAVRKLGECESIQEAAEIIEELDQAIPI